IHVFVQQHGKRSPAFASGSELKAGVEDEIRALATSTSGNIIVQSAFAQNRGGGAEGLRIKFGETKSDYLEIRQIKTAIYEIDMHYADFNSSIDNHIDPQVRHPENGN